MAKHSMKVKGKEIGPAKVYAPPHTMDGQPTNVTTYTKTERPVRRSDGQTKHVQLVLLARATTPRSILMGLV
jgi:hypothetical protein